MANFVAKEMTDTMLRLDAVDSIKKENPREGFVIRFNKFFVTNGVVAPYPIDTWIFTNSEERDSVFAQLFEKYGERFAPKKVDKSRPIYE